MGDQNDSTNEEDSHETSTGKGDSSSAPTLRLVPRPLDEPVVGDDEPQESQTGSMRQAFDEQLTDALYKSILRFAQKRAALVRGAGIRVDSQYAQDLVNDALADTLRGTVSWSAERCPLLLHLRSVVKSRTWRAIRDGQRAPHIGLDDADGTRQLAEEAMLHGTDASVSPIMLAALSERVVLGLRGLIKGDLAAMAIVDAWSAGHIERDDVLERTGLSEAAYKKARARIQYLAGELSNTLRVSARDHLRRAQ